MSTAIIILKDDPDGTVSVSLDFTDSGAEDESPAHNMALAMIRSQTGGVDEDEED